MTIQGVGQMLSLNLGSGDGRHFTLSIRQRRNQLLRAMWSRAKLRRARRSETRSLRSVTNTFQTTLIEAAKVATRWHPELAALYEREKQKGHRNRGTLAVARKIVAYLLSSRSKRTKFSNQSRRVEKPAVSGRGCNIKNR